MRRRIRTQRFGDKEVGVEAIFSGTSKQVRRVMAALQRIADEMLDNDDLEAINYVSDIHLPPRANKEAGK